MGFHIPPTMKWDTESVCQSLNAIGLPTRIEAGNVRIDAIPSPCANRLFAIFKRMGSTRYPPYHEFRLYSDRFVNNLDIAWNLDSLAEDDQIIDDIAVVLRNHGYPDVGMDPTERDIAKRYGPIGDELNSTLTELETLRAQFPYDDPVKWWPAWTALNAKMERLLVREYSDSLS